MHGESMGGKGKAGEQAAIPAASAAAAAAGYAASASPGQPWPGAMGIPAAGQSGQMPVGGYGYGGGEALAGQASGKAQGKGVAQDDEGYELDSEDDDCSDCCSSDCYGKEEQHFADVCYSLVGYDQDALIELECVADTFAEVNDPLDRQLLKPPGDDVLKDMKKCVEANAKFLKLMVEADEDACQFAKIPEGHQIEDRNSSKARTVLRQMVRDWADEGAKERQSQYGCLLSALHKYVPLKGRERKPPKVVAPGSGLSRLPFEIAARGYSAQGNEFSYHMLQGSKWVLNGTSGTKTHTIYPFIFNLENRRTSTAQLRAVKVPDVCPAEVLCPGRPADFSMCAGEFVDVYKDQINEWDAMLTCFFLDTAKNVFLYIRVIADIVKPGGLWANIGPLLYHYAEQPDAISIELSWEEVKPAISKYFDFKEEELRYAYYTTNEQGLFHTRYKCIYFAAIRNNTPTDGVSHPVF